jgi:hypothetical protein
LVETLEARTKADAMFGWAHEPSTGSPSHRLRVLSAGNVMLVPATDGTPTIDSSRQG